MADVFSGKKLAYVIEILNDAGQPARVDGVPVAASSDETVLTVQPAADGMSGEVTAVANGVARMTITADADLDATGVRTITGVSEDVNVTDDPASAASTFRIVFTPVADPAPPAPTP